MLVGLVIVPIVLLLDLLARRRRARYAIAFSNVDVLRSVVPRTPPWRRYLPLTLLLAALAALVVGLARPERAVSVARKQATVIMAMDTSGSMVAKDVAPTRLGAATAAATKFVDGLPSSYKVSLVPFATTASVAVSPTSDHAQVKTALARLRARGGTAIGDAITLGLAIGRPARRGRRPAAAGGLEGHRARDPAALRRLQLRGHRPGDRGGAGQGRGRQGVHGRLRYPQRRDQLRSLRPDLPRAAGPGDAQGRRADDRRRVLHGRRRRDAAPRVREHRQDRRRDHRHQDVSYAFAGLGAVLLTAAGLLSMLWRSPLA